ncbi:hypothetical protein KBC55_03155 [Patescibacteria group bacterium]|nr:hypothetical protein [Patescibacteria group bacterium]
MNRDAGTFILRLYFAVVSAVTLFTLMFGAIDLLTIGLKKVVFKAADVPSWGLEDCSVTGPRYAVSETEAQLDEAEYIKQCEARNADMLKNYKVQTAENMVRNLALIIISSPLFLIHFRTLYRDLMEEHKK